MNLKRINKTSAQELELEGITWLISYSTAVACHVPGRGFLKTSKYHSNTTSKQINQFLKRHGGTHFNELPQEWFDKSLGFKKAIIINDKTFSLEA